MTTLDSVQPSSPAPPQGLRELVGRLAAAFDTGALGPGEIAQLRRLHSTTPDQPAFWKLAALVLSPDQPLPDGAERRWAAVLSGLARLGARSHDPRRSAGEVLASAGLSELRFQRLLRSEGQALADTFRRTCAFLAQKAETVDWTGLARLVLETDPDRRETTRRELARDYYRALHRAEQED